MIHRRLLVSGMAIWAIATVALRLGGQYMLRPAGGGTTLVLFAASFLLMAGVSRRLCRAAGLAPAQWPAGAVSLALPTLVLDPFSSAFFPAVFPNMPPEAAGTFGGWILCCCAGAFAGVMILGRDRDRTPEPARG